MRSLAPSSVQVQRSSHEQDLFWAALRTRFAANVFIGTAAHARSNLSTRSRQEHAKFTAPKCLRHRNKLFASPPRQLVDAMGRGSLVLMPCNLHVYSRSLERTGSPVRDRPVEAVQIAVGAGGLRSPRLAPLQNPAAAEAWPTWRQGKRHPSAGLLSGFKTRYHGSSGRPGLGRTRQAVLQASSCPGPGPKRSLGAECEKWQLGKPDFFCCAEMQEVQGAGRELGTSRDRIHDGIR